MAKRKNKKLGLLDLNDENIYKELTPENMQMKRPKWVVKSRKLTEKQKLFLELALEDETNIIFVDGPAGSTKTYMAVYSALRMLREDDDLDLLYLRTIIESGSRNMGALPGNVEEKFCPYSQPLQEKLEELLDRDVISDLEKTGKLEAQPINFIRGANWRNKIVIADECQNFTFKEIYTMITRLGENSKLFVCGDSSQADIPNSGFKEMKNLFSFHQAEERGIYHFPFDTSDIKRSKFLSFIIKTVERHNTINQKK